MTSLQVNWHCQCKITWRKNHQYHLERERTTWNLPSINVRPPDLSTWRSSITILHINKPFYTLIRSVRIISLWQCRLLTCLYACILHFHRKVIWVFSFLAEKEKKHLSFYLPTSLLNHSAKIVPIVNVSTEKTLYCRTFVCLDHLGPI